MLAAVAGTSPQRRSRASLSHEQPGEALSESCPAPRHLAGFSRFSSHYSTRLDLVFRFDIRAAAAVEARGPWPAGGLSPSQPRGGSSQPASRPYRSQDFISSSPTSLTLSEEAICMLLCSTPNSRDLDHSDNNITLLCERKE